MTDIETAIMIKNMARETVRRMSAAAKNAPEIVLKDVPKGATFIVRDFNNNIVASIAADKVTDETLNRWIRRGFKVAVKNAVRRMSAKNAKTAITDKIKEIYDREGEAAALDWIRKHPSAVIEKIKKQDESTIQARLEHALEQYK